jgi:hypothetical protein
LTILDPHSHGALFQVPARRQVVRVINGMRRGKISGVFTKKPFKLMKYKWWKHDNYRVIIVPPALFLVAICFFDLHNKFVILLCVIIYLIIIRNFLASCVTILTPDGKTEKFLIYGNTFRGNEIKVYRDLFEDIRDKKQDQECRTFITAEAVRFGSGYRSSLQFIGMFIGMTMSFITGLMTHELTGGGTKSLSHIIEIGLVIILLFCFFILQLHEVSRKDTLSHAHYKLIESVLDERIQEIEKDNEPVDNPTSTEVAAALDVVAHDTDYP